MSPFDELDGRGVVQILGRENHLRVANSETGSVGKSTLGDLKRTAIPAREGEVPGTRPFGNLEPPCSALAPGSSLP
jgi:hypothetical protein